MGKHDLSISTDTLGASRGRRWHAALWGGAAALLLVPAVAMRFTPEVRWTGLDFAVFGAMLAGACLAFELAARAARHRTYLLAAALAIGTGFLLLWATLAVGFFGDERDPANALVLGVLAVALIGAVLARRRSAGMARAMLATALAQGLLSVVASVAGLRHPLPAAAVFVALWLLAAALFRRSARAEVGAH
jgi:hypothetical protein